MNERSATTRVGGAPSEVFDLDVAVVDDARGLRAEWNGLAGQCPETSYFQTADWVLSWWETVARRPATTVACWRASDGTLDAVAAVSRGRALLHRRLGLSLPVVTLAGSGPGDADHCGAVARASRRDDVAAWLRAAAGGRTFVAEGLVPGNGIAPRGARILERNRCPQLALDRGDGRPHARSSNFRSQLGRFARRIERAGVTFEWRGPGTVPPEVVTDLLDLHARRRAGRGQSTTLTTAHRELLLRCAGRADAGADRGPAAVVARKGDDVVGVLLGFWWNRCFSAYQKGWDPAYAPFSIGSLLVAEAITNAQAAGAATFDFLRGTEDYKYRFGAVDRDDIAVVVPAGPVGAMFTARALALARRDARGHLVHPSA